MKIQIWQSALLLSGVVASTTIACSRSSSDDAEATPSSGEPCSNWISGARARRLISEGGLLLDVRSAEEFAGEHLDGATNIDVGDLPDRIDEIPKDQHVVVYCQSGRRAHQAALLLKERGYTVSEIGTQSQYSPTAPAGCGDT